MVMINLSNWQLNNPKWLGRDIALITSDAGWKEATKKDGITIWQRSFADDKNDLFRWRISNVAAQKNVVYYVFVNKIIDYYQYCTARHKKLTEEKNTAIRMKIA